MPKSAARIAACLVFAGIAGAQNPANSLNPSVQKLVESVSEQRIGSILAKLESFGTRHVMSAQDDPSRGIGAAMRWIHDELQSYSPRLQVSYQPFKVRKAGAYAHDADLANVIAVLPGTTSPETSILVSAHYDSVNGATRPVPNPTEQAAALIRGGMAEDEARRYVERFPATAGTTDAEATAAQKVAPGVSDDASGTAIVLELARVLSQYRFRKTLVFVAFSAEEGSHAGKPAG